MNEALVSPKTLTHTLAIFPVFFCEGEKQLGSHRTRDRNKLKFQDV